MNQPKTLAQKAGFTLIELSIVLVIIGLIVGGVLVGQDLIKAAELRAGVKQVENYFAAANTFRSKYNGLPGDIPNPANYGFTATGLPSSTGNGDGVLDRAGGSADANDINQESAAFFKHLSQASMISEAITATDFSKAALTDEATILPASKLGKGLRLAAFGTGGLNYFIISQLDMTPVAGEVAITSGTEMAVIDAFGFDNKMDDGNPTTGIVNAVTDLVTIDAGNAGPLNGACVDSTGNDLYQLSSQLIAANTACSIRIRASF